MRGIMCVLLAACLLALLSGCGGGGGSSAQFGSIDGYIYAARARAAALTVSPTARAGDTAVAGVTVTVRGYPDLSAVSDTLGHFVLPNVPLGPQQLYLSGANYTRLTLSVTVTEGLTHLDSLSLPSAAGKWTVMVFMNANNDMVQEGLDDLNEMERAPNATEVKTLVQFARQDLHTTKRYEVTQDINDSTDLVSTVRADIGQVDMGDPLALRAFIAWCQSLYPAEHYMLVIWDHGSGWDPTNDRVRARAISFDDVTGHAIRDADLPIALTATYPLDIVATDACLMNMLEVAYQIRHKAEFLVGSEDETPLMGFNYEHVVNRLTNPGGASISPSAYAQFLAEDAFTTWGGTANASLFLASSAIDLARIDAVAAAANTLAGRLLEISASHSSDIARCRQNTTSFRSGDSYPFADLAHFAALLKQEVNDAALKSYAGAVQTAVDQAVITNKVTTPYAQAKGLSIYYPTYNSYLRTGASVSYPLMALAQDTLWDDWLMRQPQ